jgi:hypothetical protein
MNTTPLDPALPKPSLLRWEIAIAVLIKILLLIGLWFLIFRWMDKPVSKPDVAAHFALPATQAVAPTDIPSQSLTQDTSHVR